MWNILEFQMAHGGLVANSENNFSVLMRCKFGWKEYNYDRLDIWINGSLTKAKVDLIFKSILKNISNANTDYSSINEIVNSIKGSFALIIRSEQWIYAACDKVKSIPVSFVIVNNKIIVGDYAPLLVENANLNKKNIDKFAVLQIAMSGYCFGNRTLYNNVYQLAAGQSIMVNANSVIRDYYYTYSPWKIKENISKSKWVNKFSEVCWAAIDELIESADGRQIVIPLSAGNDSRLIASLLHEKKVKDVVCFSYGKKNNFEIQTAELISKKLGYQWLGISCNVNSQRFFFQSTVYKEYVDTFESYNSIPAVHDISVISNIYENNLISQDSIIVNGSTGDFISGGHINANILSNTNINSTMDDYISYFLDKHYSLWNNLRTNENDKKIIDGLLSVVADRGISKTINSDNMYSFYETIEYAGRQTQYVINQQRAYDFFGYGWRLPLWSDYFLDFWEQVPVQYKVNQNLYIDTLKKNNWGKVWLDYPVNMENVTPVSLKVLRNFIKLFFTPFGRDNWHDFDKRVFQYWTYISCNTAVSSYNKVLFDSRGYRNYISWVTDQYLKGKDLEI